MTTLPEDITVELVRDVKYRLLEECMPRIKLCLDKLPEEQVWWRPNNTSNSIGNLVLHLAGNVRQWIMNGIAGKPDTRKRQQEFDEEGPLPKDVIWERLKTVMLEVVPVLDGITPEQLVQKRPVQVYEESVISILVHVTEHFSYHTGQIAWITKMLTDKDLGFYKGIDLG